MMALHTPGMILLIDDAPRIVRALAQLLRRDGYTVETAATGRHALAQRHGQPFDVIEQGGAPVPGWSHPAEQRGRHGRMRGRSHPHVHHHLVSHGTPRLRVL